MDFMAYLKDSTMGSLNSVFSMAKIIIPLMIAMEILKDAEILEKISKRLKPISKLFDISNESVFPLMIGMVFGLVYGAGIIVESVEKKFKQKDLYIVMNFLLLPAMLYLKIPLYLLQ